MDSSIFIGSSPWQQWGNTQVLTVPPDLFTNPNLHEQQITLCRVQYNRPETWRFLAAARIIDAPAAPDGLQGTASVWFELFTGIGRSAIRIPFWITLSMGSWSGGEPPRNLVQWTNKAPTTVPVFSFDNQTPQVSWESTDYADTLVGQDMTLVAHAVFTSNIPGTQPALIEVSAQFSPNVHVRPDWYQIEGHPGEQFAGGEVKGR